MSNHDFTLKSGAILHISMAPFEASIALNEAVMEACKGLSREVEVNEVIRSSSTVRKALYQVFPWTTYNNVKIYPGLFDEPEIGEKARADYYEICSRIVEINARPFFLTISSGSITPDPVPPESQKQP